MTYIFSNAHKYDTLKEFGNHIDNLKLNLSDKIVLLNTCVPLQANINYFSNKNNISVLCRGFSVGCVISYFGLEEVLKRQDIIKNVYCCEHSDTNLNIFLTRPREWSTKETININNDFFKKYPENKVPTTGYIAYYLFKEIYKDDITLVNFYGSGDNSTCKYQGHNWDFEEEFFKDKIRIFI